MKKWTQHDAVSTFYLEYTAQKHQQADDRQGNAHDRTDDRQADDHAHDHKDDAKHHRNEAAGEFDDAGDQFPQGHEGPQIPGDVISCSSCHFKPPV
jgi:hypothetical protein